MSLALAANVSSLSLLLFAVSCTAATINFETALPGGLSPVYYPEDTPVTPQARITNQYGNLGVLMSNVALVNLGFGHATSGTNGIGGISPGGTVDYGSPMIFTFVDPLDNSMPATTERFTISTDQWGSSLNTTTVSGYDLAGNFIGSVSHLEKGGSVTLELKGVGKFHKVIVASTLMNHLSGGIGLDDLHFDPGSSPSVPEATPVALTGIGLVVLLLAIFVTRRSR